MVVALAVEHFGMMPDALLATIDRTAAESGRSAKAVLLELVAHFELKDQDHRAYMAKQRANAYANS